MKHQKTCTVFKIQHNLQQGCPTQTRHVLDNPDVQNYSRNSNCPKTLILKFPKFEHFLKILPDAKFKPKFRTCPELSGPYGKLI